MMLQKKSWWPTERKPEHQRAIKNNGPKNKEENREKQKSEWKPCGDHSQNIPFYVEDRHTYRWNIDPFKIFCFIINHMNLFIPCVIVTLVW